MCNDCDITTCYADNTTITQINKKMRFDKIFLPWGDISAPGDGVCLFITDECGIPRPRMVMGLLLEFAACCDCN